MKTAGSVFLLATASAFAGCDGSALDPDPAARTFDLDFTGARHGWVAGFADYPVGQEESMGLTSGHEPLPDALPVDGRGLYVAGTNHSDDLFMFWKGRVEGLEPGTTYRVEFRVEFATEAPSDCVGIGGPPGEAVRVKAGAIPTEPQPVVEAVGGRDYYRMNIDKDNQATGGSDALVLGHVGNARSECSAFAWEMKTLLSEESLEMTAAADGSAWLIVGTDSGFEGRTRIYFTRVVAEFQPVSAG